MSREYIHFTDSLTVTSKKSPSNPSSLVSSSNSDPLNIVKSGIRGNWEVALWIDGESASKGKRLFTLNLDFFLFLCGFVNFTLSYRQRIPFFIQNQWFFSLFLIFLFHLPFSFLLPLNEQLKTGFNFFGLQIMSH